MTEDGRAESARAEIGLADEELRAAETLLVAGLPRIALTRAYFAVFHVIRAKLYADDFEPRSHRGTQHLFNLHYVKTGVVGADASRIMARLQKFREEADYAQAFVIDDAGAREEVQAARDLVGRISTSIE